VLGGQGEGLAAYTHVRCHHSQAGARNSQISSKCLI
jgi:hypothetical protein